MLSLATLTLLTFATLSYAIAGPDALTGNTTLHDPSMCRDDSGKYFVFSTGVGIEIRTSTDRTAWTLAGKVWPEGAPWTDKYAANGSLWAPDCTYLNGEFWLYYSASTSGSRKSAIFLAKSSTGAPGNWTHEGMITSTSCSNNYNAIDPNLLIDGGKWYLSLGSFWTGIKSLNINPSNGLPFDDSDVIPLAQRTENNGAMEGSAVFKFNNHYYLFTSWDRCCNGTSSTYNIRVGRSTSPTGGYVDNSGVALTDGGGTLVLGTHDNIVGPGGQDIMLDADGPILVYHYYTPDGNFLGINRLDFSSGWPVVV